MKLNQSIKLLTGLCILASLLLSASCKKLTQSKAMFELADFNYDPTQYKTNADLMGRWREYGNIEVNYKGDFLQLYLNNWLGFYDENSIFIQKKYVRKEPFMFENDTAINGTITYYPYLNYDGLVANKAKFIASAEVVFHADGTVQRFKTDSANHVYNLSTDLNTARDGSKVVFWAVNDPNLFLSIDRYVSKGVKKPYIDTIRYTLSANKDTIFPMVNIKGQWRKRAGHVNLFEWGYNTPMNGGFLVRIKK